MKELQSISVVAPGFYGINTQDSSVTLPNTFALVAENCVIDRYGRLGARKGWTQQTTSGSSALSGNKITFLMEHINADGTTDILSAGNNNVFRGGVGGALIPIKPAGYAISNNYWKGASLDDHAIMVQQGQEPLVFTRESGSPACTTMTNYTHHGTNNPNYGTNYPRDIIAAYGRFWVHNGSYVYWSTDVADASFPYFNGGSSGSLNIAAVLPNNTDEIVSIAAHNGFLTILCKNNIVIYQGATNPTGTDFKLTDVIVGVGCVARDSVQHTGNDLLFLSNSGLRSVGRLIQEKSLPMRDLSKNVRDDIADYLAIETNQYAIKGVYSETDAFYLLSFPTSKVVYCFDMRQALEDGSARVTNWTSYDSGAFLRRQNKDVLIGKVNGIGKYELYSDNGIYYWMKFSSNHIDFQDSTITKILKKINTTVIGGSGQIFTLRAGYDYYGPTYAYQFTVNEGLISEYGTAQFNINEFVAGVLVDQIQAPANGAGKVVQISFEARIDGEELSVQRLDIFVKTGRKS